MPTSVFSNILLLITPALRYFDKRYEPSHLGMVRDSTSMSLLWQTCVEEFLQVHTTTYTLPIIYIFLALFLMHRAPSALLENQNYSPRIVLSNIGVNNLCNCLLDNSVQLLLVSPISETHLLFLLVFLPYGLGWVCISHPSISGLVAFGYF